MTDLALTAAEREHLTAAARFDAIRDHWRTAERHRLTACALLADADRRRDWETLGLGSFSEYARGLGIPESTARKMRTVGQTFTVNAEQEPGEPEPIVTPTLWQSLPESDQDELSLERLYVSAQRVQTGQVSPEEALADAVANPPHELINLRNGGPQPEAQLHRCPLCNQEHVGCINEAGSADPDDELPF